MGSFTPVPLWERGIKSFENSDISRRFPKRNELCWSQPWDCSGLLPASRKRPVVTRISPISVAALNSGAVHVRILDSTPDALGQYAPPELDEGSGRAENSAKTPKLTRRSKKALARPSEFTLERQLAETQKLACMSRAMAGVAHDLRNVLTGISLLSEVLTTRLADTPDQSYATELTRSAHDAQELLQQMLSVARPAEAQAQALLLNPLLAGMRGLLQQIVGPTISVQLCCDHALGAVKLAPAQVRQILLNLVFNARDAMPSGGRLTLETSSARLSRTQTRYGKIRFGKYVKLVVRDTGCGMDAVTRARACDPFFTTKPGSGTGLGLAMVRRIVIENAGALRIESRPGKGTAVIILLPEHNGSDTPAQNQNSAAGRHRPGSAIKRS